MTTDIFKSRERAFEAVYFAKVDAELIDKIHKKRERDTDRALLALATGISDDDLLQEILELGVTTSTLEALSLAPLVCVAWGNGSLDQEESAAAIKAATSEGLEKDSPSFQLFERWLSRKPDESLMTTWREYIRSLMEHLDENGCNTIRQDLKQRAEAIARTTGGVLGVGSISSGERAVLRKIE
ncbi:MAG: hypothetical protein ACI8W3_002172, partial [Myxococcota bacterium]